MLSPGEYLAYAIISFFTAMVSGIAGAGGGFINTPLLIFFGLTPAQAVATGKLGGLGISLGSIKGLRKAKLHSWRMVLPVMAIALVVGLFAPFIIMRLESEVYKQIMGFLILVMIPIMLFKKVGHHKYVPTPKQKFAGWILITLALVLQAIFSGGVGTLVNVSLMALLGMDALEANITKRYSQVTLNIILVLGLLSSGLIIWSVAIISLTMGVIGGSVGSRLALRKGSKFVTYALIAFMLLAAAELLFG